MQSIMPPTLDTILETAAAFDDGVFELLNELIQKPTSTDPTDAELKELSESAKVPEDDLRYFLSFLDFLFARTEDIPDGDLQQSLLGFLRETTPDVDAEKLAPKLGVLLAHRDVQVAATKNSRLRAGLLPNITGLANFVDLRSDFKRHGDGTLTGDLGDAVSVIQLGIQTNSPRDNERHVLLQLDERSLTKLEKCVEEIREKLKILSDN